MQKQIELGIDVIDDGEYSKPSFVTYVNERLAGFEVDKERRAAARGRARARRCRFPEFYAQGHVGARQNRMVCTGPVTYKGHALLQRDIANLKAAIGDAKVEAFMPAISPSNIEEWQRNAYYKTSEEYLFAIADAMREEYKAIVDAGFLLQIDDPRLVSYYLVKPDASIAECRKWANAARRGAQSCAARHPAGAHPPPHLLRHQHGAARARHGGQAPPRHHPEDQRRRLFVRGGEPAARARMEDLGECQAAEGQGADPWRHQPFDRAGRASGARRRAHREVTRASSAASA